ncbi:MAG: hypothetical protein KZQ88_18550 [Candidatus Thiodiazotropha sp. (ex Dulcina madagascariensis)]|nr:hypothetical protein [Candidatus Thiodiazotropha sp. (ex Dulcina madagascariensis)]
MSEVYKVIFTGQLRPDADKERVIVLFSEKFKLGRERAEKLVHSGRPLSLKKDLDREKARKYQEALEKLGLIIEIDPKLPAGETAPEASSPASGLTLEAFDHGDEDATEVLDPSQVPGDRCPKCGSGNMEMGICQDCGIVAVKYLAAQERHAESAARMETEQTEQTEQTEEEDPYTTPEAELVQPLEDEMDGPRGVPAGHGLAWVAKGWWHFKQAPIAWIAALIVWGVVSFIVSMVPLLGFIAANVLTPVMIAGLMIGCSEQDQGEEFSVNHLFAGFSNNAGQAMLVGLFYLLMIVLVGVSLMAFMFGSIGQIMSQETANPEAMAMMLFSPTFIIGLIVGSLLFLPIIMAYLFAPALVALEELSAWEAMKLSFMGCLKNLMPLTVYSLVSVGLVVVGSIPFGLGLLIVFPILTGAVYSAYRDIYYG